MDASTLRLCASFFAGVAAGAGFVICHHARASYFRMSTRGNTLPCEHPSSRLSSNRSSATAVVDDEIVAEQFTRNVQFFGVESQKKVTEAFVVVIGLGGVGSHCAHMLLRSGVSRLRLVDFDQVSVSSLNRHALATRSDVGTSKAECLKYHFKRIYPEARIDAKVMLYDQSREEELLGDSPDFVVDCIDNVETKVDLLAACVRRKIKVLACGGAGAKCDPTRIRFVDIAESVVDPLARAVRHRLKRQHGIEAGIWVLLSTEKPRCDLVSIDSSEGTVMTDYQMLPNFRIRTIPVFGALPAIFGMACAAHVVTHLARQTFDPEPVLRMQKKQYETQLDRLRDREDARGSKTSSIAVDIEDIVYLVKDVWHARSARAQTASKSKGMWRNTSGLCLTRWDPTRPACLDNLILLTLDEADAHDTEVWGTSDEFSMHGKGLETLQLREPGFASSVETKFERVRVDFQLSKIQLSPEPHR